MVSQTHWKVSNGPTGALGKSVPLRSSAARTSLISRRTRCLNLSSRMSPPRPRSTRRLSTVVSQAPRKVRNGPTGALGKSVPLKSSAARTSLISRRARCLNPKSRAALQDPTVRQAVSQAKVTAPRMPLHRRTVSPRRSLAPQRPIPLRTAPRPARRRSFRRIAPAVGPRTHLGCPASPAMPRTPRAGECWSCWAGRPPPADRKERT